MAGMPPPPPETEYDFGAADQLAALRLRRDDRAGRARAHRRHDARGDVDEGRRGAAGRRDDSRHRRCGRARLDERYGDGRAARSATTDTMRVLARCSASTASTSIRAGRFAVVWFDLAKAIADGGIVRHRQLPGRHRHLAGAGRERAVEPHRRVPAARGAVRRAGNRAYVITQDGVSVIDLAYATTARADDRAADSGRRSGDPAERPRGRHRRDRRVRGRAPGRAASTLRDRQRRQRRPALAFTDPARIAARPTSISRPTAARIYAVAARRRRSSRSSTSRAMRSTRAASRRVDLDERDARLARAVARRHAAACCSRTRRSTSASRSSSSTSPAIPHVTWPLKKSRARGRHLADRRHRARPQREGVRRSGARATNFDDFIDKSYGYTLLDLATGFGKLQITPVDPGPFTYAPDGSKVYVALDGGDARDRDARAAGRDDADRRRDHQAARLAAVVGRHPARRGRKRSSRSAIRSAACRSSTSPPTRFAPSPASTSTATS